MWFYVFLPHVLHMDLRWVWSEALTNPALESSVGVGGFGYPVCWIGVGWAGGIGK